MSSYVVRTRRTEGEGRYAVHETGEALDVWARQGATLTSTVALVTFLNAHCVDMGAHDVRRMLAPISDLDPLPNPPSAVAPTDRVPVAPTASGCITGNPCTLGCSLFCALEPTDATAGVH